MNKDSAESADHKGGWMDGLCNHMSHLVRYLCTDECNDLSRLLYRNFIFLVIPVNRFESTKHKLK